MAHRPAGHCISNLGLLALLTALTGGGCARGGEGMRILDELRRDGLLDENRAGDPVPSALLVAAAPDDALLADGSLSIDALCAVADRSNPRIAAARAAIGAAGGEAWQATLPPNPSLELEVENLRTSGDGVDGRETTLSIAQPLVLGGRLDAALGSGLARVEAERQRLEIVRREVHGEIRRAVTAMVWARHAIGLHEELLQMAHRSMEIAAARFEARAAPEAEAIRARVEAQTLELALESLRADLDGAGARLEALLGGRRVEAEWIDPRVLDLAAATRLPEIALLREAVRSDHPALRAARADVERAERDIDLARSRGVPDLTARVGVGFDHADDEGFVEAGAGLPLPLFDRNQGDVLAARFAAIRARAEAEAAGNDLAADLAEAHAEWTSAAARLALYEEEILTGARRAHEQSLAGYEAGALPLLDLLDAQRTLTEATIAHAELRRSLALALADILEITGEHNPLQDRPGDSP